MTQFDEAVYTVTRQVPKGMVISYGQIACWLGKPRASRLVGAALHRNPFPGLIPCHRVVFQDGSLASSFAFGGSDAQRRLLEAEGIVFDDKGHIDMQKYRWQGPPDFQKE